MIEEQIDNKAEDNIGEKYFETIRKKTLWEEYTYDAKAEASKNDIKSKMKVLDTPIKIQIPSRDNIRYSHIKNFEDHDLSNNLAIDMIIRNNKFQNYMYNISTINYEFKNKPLAEKEKYYKKIQRAMIEKFGFNIKEEINLLGHHPYINEQIDDYLKNVANESLILNPPYISDLENGLRRVINYYFEKKKLYILIPPTQHEIIDYKNNENIDKNRIFVKIINPNNYQPDFILLSAYKEYEQYLQRIDELFYLLPKAKMEIVDSIDDEFIKNNLNYLGIQAITFGTKKIVSLAEDPFPIEFLDEEFILSLSDDEILDTHFKDSECKSILPKIKLLNSKRINTAINLNISSNEVNAKVANLQLNSKNIKSFVDIFNKEVEDIIKVKNLHHISKSKEKRNRDYSNAFFIYDLYKIISSEFIKKTSELEQEAQTAKEKIKDNPQYDSKEIKQHEYDKIDDKLARHISLFSKTKLDEEIQKITSIEISKLRGLHALMKEYIDDSRFRNVILTQHTSTFL
ncbi:hypothetical protein [Halarcobacter bivalviorum]|uniref:hypothetical protein n=1 Tax=Halarcobacter bivalviorum TaxID=663364 RepID=UPI00100AD999|nr:hypothetical protein [Halarcobacter bivalviorum]RXK03325.1 hypothetical protein CRU97_12440 [Halarcobacter bivalviorum]